MKVVVLMTAMTVTTEVPGRRFEGPAVELPSLLLSDLILGGKIKSLFAHSKLTFFL